MTAANVSGQVFSQIGPWGMVPAWVLLAKDKHGKGLSGADLRVYIALRTFADRLGSAFPHVPTIAARADVTPRTAEKSITRLRELGLLKSKRRYRPDGSIAGCDYTLRDIPPSPDEPDDAETEEVPAISTVPPGEMAGTPRPDGRSSNTPEKHPKRTPHRSEQSGPATSSRFAPSGVGAHEDDFSDPWATADSKPPTTAEKLTRKRSDDRELFLSLIDAKRLQSDGTTFREGVFDAHLFYDGFRKLKSGDEKIGFPGAYIASMHTNEHGSGVEDWLLSLGIEPA